MKTIRISDTKIKVMLSKQDVLDSPVGEGMLDTESYETREAIRGFLEEAGREHGVDISSGRLFIQLYPDKDGGCEMFVTRLDGKKAATLDNKTQKEEMPMIPRGAVKAESTEKITRTSRYNVGIYEFAELDALLCACGRLSESGTAGQSAAYAGEYPMRYFLVICESGARSDLPTDALIDEYGGKRRKNEVYAYIKEHCGVVCGSDAVQCLGALA